MRKIILLILGVVLFFGAVGGGYYFWDCTNNHPLFYKQRTGEYRYTTTEALNYCWNFLFQPNSPMGEDFSTAVPIMGSRESFLIAPGTKLPSYNSSPPTSGWNYKLTGDLTKWTRHVSYYNSIPPEAAVAKLYGGFIWITFKNGGEVSEGIIAAWKNKGVSDEIIKDRLDRARTQGRVSDEVINELKKIAASTPIVLVTGRALLDHDIVLNALGRQDKFDLENGQLIDELKIRIWDFILRYRNQPKLADNAPINLKPVSAASPADSQIPSGISE